MQFQATLLLTAQFRLNQLVNNNFGAPVATAQHIVVTALNGGNDPHGSGDITGNGATYVDSTGPSPVIRIVYNVSQCCGKGNFGLDSQGNHITTPNLIILFHEFSHAFRAVTGTNQASNEPPTASASCGTAPASAFMCSRSWFASHPAS
ncbi:hypothetical protein [Paraburkholderia sp. Cpub6]|uniref:hypothetical protein n=1 Tax=Paraburkholderia sp. Cpub6 TaxID=2723094 RepID=UPI001622000D|nr:hypothetical protein [Paraburkholderia sp. Cpub6]MBB5460512.1 hypothetical protein [Paraburkholderia sp. Cpub6]